MSLKHRVAHSLFSSPSTRKIIDSMKPLSSGLYIFLWHDVTDKPSAFMHESQMFSTVSEFVQQIQFIREHFHIISPTELITTDINDLESEHRYAVVSFDDAWLGIFNAIQNVLKPLGIKPIIFTNYGAVENRVDFSAYQRYASKTITLGDDIKRYRSFVENFVVSVNEMAVNAPFQTYQGEIMTQTHLRTLEASESAYFSNHLYNHFDCGKIDLYTFINEFEMNRKALSSFSNYLDLFAFPYGDPALNSKPEIIRYLLQHNVPYFWANMTWNSIEVESSKACYGRIGIQRETPAELWIKIRRSTQLTERNRA